MRLLRAIAVIASLATMLGACQNLMESGDEDKAAQLERHRQRWNAAGIHDYRMQVRLQGAWFHGSALIEVRNGVAVSITPVDAGNVGTNTQVYRHYDTVDEMFGVIERAIQQKADHLDVKYNESLGNPIDVYVDHANVIDEEHGFVVEDFHVLR